MTKVELQQKTENKIPVNKSIITKKRDLKKIKNRSRKIAKNAHNNLDKKIIKSKRSAKYQNMKRRVDDSKDLSISDAVEKIKELSYAKFDATVELHVRLHNKNKKTDETNVRGMIDLPSGSPKKYIIEIASDESVEKIKSGKTNFDILLAKPDMMPKLASVAKILGPKGKMPSPKSGTVTEDPENTKKELLHGKVDYKTDAHGNIHIPVGKISWDNDKTTNNIEAFISILPKGNIAKVYLSATMSPSVRICVK